MTGVDAPFVSQAEYWGQTFEVLVKRGVLAVLVEHGLLAHYDPRVARWRETRLASVCGRLLDALDVGDPAAKEVVSAAFDHLALTAYGLGYTAMREYLRPHRRHIESKRMTLRGLYCPLTLPGMRSNDEDDRIAARQEFVEGFGLSGPVDPAWTDKGRVARADFLLWLAGPKEDLLLAQEYSYDVPAEIADFRFEEAHLEELLRHRRIVESRGVFARVNAEVEGESFELADDLKNHLIAFTSDDKPLYKLCQACAYAESAVELLQSRGLMPRPCTARSLAITPNGLESLAARFGPGDDPRRQLMRRMATAYRETRKLPDGDEAALAAKAREVFYGVLRRLPKDLQRGMRELGKTPEPGSDFLFEFEEDAGLITNPMQRYSLDEALAQVEDAPELDAYFGGSARAAVGAALKSNDGSVTLRDLHAAAVIAAMRVARRNALNVLALEGNPGIGKTTAVIRHLGEGAGGYLFLYLSPRVVINRDVNDKMARRHGQPTGTLTVTTNATLIAAASRWHRAEVDAGRAKHRHIDAAVVADGVDGLAVPQTGSTVVIDPSQEHEIERKHAGSRFFKSTLSEHEDLVQERSLPGVLATIAGTTRELLALNPGIKQVVLTAALQGFREKANRKTTIDALSGLFRNRADRESGIRERRVFAEKHPTIVVMVDELAGDGAGAPFVHAVAEWLEKEFIEPFDGDSPFTVILVVSDASLANEVVMDRYLNAADRSPDKVLISESGGAHPFKLSAARLKIAHQTRPTLHVMTNSFPATQLDIRYRVRLSEVPLKPVDGVFPPVRKAIREAVGEQQMDSAEAAILKALSDGAVQVIFFAQDKGFNSDLKGRLVRHENLGLDASNVELLDSSVPASKRKKLVEPVKRDSVRVFLMTSSGARGISFPKADRIIAAVPRFNIEQALMEIAQLIYRGRGSYVDEYGLEQSGDHAHRHLVFLVDDFLLHEGSIDVRQWLRQALDLLTLLVMLRSTIFTRITGDAGLRQKIALVPVGGVGLEELVSVMGQHVNDFLREADVYQRRSGDNELKGLVENAKRNVVELFQSLKLRAVAKRGVDGRSAIREADLQLLLDRAAAAVVPLLLAPGEPPAIPDNAYYAGPVVLERWDQFDKREVFVFEGHQTQLQERSAKLLGQLHAIDQSSELPSSLRTPALTLRKLLQREKPEAANEFNTLKELKSPNAWLAVPAGYSQFVRPKSDGRPFRLDDGPSWQEGLIRCLGSDAVCLPPIPSYDSFPWAVTVGQADPLQFSLVFDDRYFMASSELNFLNTLLLSAGVSAEEATD